MRQRYVWVVTEGSYSDYRIVAIFSKQAAAEEFAKQVHDGNGVEEWPLDDKAVDAREVPVHHRRLYVHRDGTVGERQTWMYSERHPDHELRRPVIAVSEYRPSYNPTVKGGWEVLGQCLDAALLQKAIDDKVRWARACLTGACDDAWPSETPEALDRMDRKAARWHAEYEKEQQEKKYQAWRAEREQPIVAAGDFVCATTSLMYVFTSTEAAEFEARYQRELDEQTGTVHNATASGTLRKDDDA